MLRALKLQKRAARVGFDWPEIDQVIDKLHEETAELKAELSAIRQTATGIRRGLLMRLVIYCLSRSTLPVKPASTRKLPLWGVIQSLSSALDILNRKLKNIIKILKKCHWMRWKDCGGEIGFVIGPAASCKTPPKRGWIIYRHRPRHARHPLPVIRGGCDQKGSFRSALKGAASSTIAAWAPASRHSRSTGAWSRGYSCHEKENAVCPTRCLPPDTTAARKRASRQLTQRIADMAAPWL